MKKLLFLYLFFSLQGLSADWHTVYAHGIVDNQTQMNRFIDAISTSQTTSVEFSDAQPASDWGLNGCVNSICRTVLGKNINRANMCMGQTDDIVQLHNAIKNQPDNSIILYGCSRGAATIINTLAEHNPSNIKALILDATPADMPATIKPLLAKIGINPDYSNTIFSTIFPAYPKNSMTPLQAIAKITNKNLPILLLHSQTDAKVPVEHSYQLYQEFKNQGFVNVELIILPEGAHSFLLQNEKIKPLYLQAVHTFYKKYNLPHDSTWTQQHFDWANYRPTNIARHIECYEKNIQKMYRKTIIKYATIATIGIIIYATALSVEQNTIVMR
jgi:pimeloyl-ACP methyl ester carboxylesterase